MARWIRFEHKEKVKFGTVDANTINVYEGDMFANPSPTGEQLEMDSIKLLTPTEPSKMVCLWNNYKMLGAKLNLDTPESPLFVIKSSSSFLSGGETIRKPQSYSGKVIFEGEVGIVIGKECRAASESAARDCIFGFTCVNDVTAIELVNKDPSFAQWTRAKSFDTFGVFGPVVASELDPETLAVKTHLNNTERQNYPVNDMIFSPYQVVSLISQDMTLLPGDIIACGTNVGVESMDPGSTIEISIEGIGTLSNKYE